MSDKFPQVVNQLPDEPLDFPYLRAISESDSVRQLWIPRYASMEEVDCDAEDVWQLRIGIIPTIDIEFFLVEGKGKYIPFKFEEGGWQIEEPTDKDEIRAQVFVHQTKGLVTIRRAHRRKQEDDRR